MSLTGTGAAENWGRKKARMIKKREFREEEEEEGAKAGQREEGRILFVESDHF